MVSTVFSRAMPKILTVTLTSADFDLTQANQTRQDVVLCQFPANMVIGQAHVVPSGATTSTATLSSFSITLGVAAAGTTLLSSTDIKAPTNARGSVTAVVSSSATTVYASFTPAGSGGNWSTLTMPATIVVTLHFSELAGSVD